MNNIIRGLCGGITIVCQRRQTALLIKYYRALTSSSLELWRLIRWTGRFQLEAEGVASSMTINF